MEWSGATTGPIRIISFFALSLGLQVGLCRVGGSKPPLFGFSGRCSKPVGPSYHLGKSSKAKARWSSTDGACRPRSSPVDWSRCENFSFQSQRTQRH
jgi:hypothetical protein